MLDGTASLQKRLSSPAVAKDAPVRMVKLAGDASTRSYFRAHYDHGGTAIIMLQAHPGQNEEATFLEIHRFLEDLGLPVPRLYDHDPNAGLVILEDLGDDLLEKVVESAPQAELRALYSEAVDLLLRMRRATEGLGSGCSAFNLAFDEEKLMQEMHFFMEHFVLGLCKLKPSPAAAAALEDFFLQLCQTIAAEPHIFTHRDYHSRNLIRHRGRLVMIDFQDARLGPAQYDLASLLRDSYVTLPEDLVAGLLNEYVAGTGVTKPGFKDRFRYIFDLMSLQRNIKALGTFGYQASVRSSRRYLSAIPRTASYIARNIGAYEEFSRFRSVVEEFICLPAHQFTIF